jgi:hypothetical protein
MKSPLKTTICLIGLGYLCLFALPENGSILSIRSAVGLIGGMLCIGAAFGFIFGFVYGQGAGRPR